MSDITDAAATTLDESLFCVAEHLRKPDAKRILIDGDLWSVNIGDRQALLEIAERISPSPSAWRWRHRGSNRWEYGQERPTGPSIHLFEVEALWSSRLTSNNSGSDK